MKIWKRLLSGVVFIVSFAAMILHFSSDINAVAVGPTAGGRQSSEVLIQSRIQQSMEKGIFSDTGTISGYYSKPAAHAFVSGVFGVIAAPLHIAPLPALRWITLFAFVSLVFLFLGWLYREFGWFPALLTWLLTFTMSWVYIFTWNTWWLLWFQLLPFTAILLFLEKKEKNPDGKITGLYILSFSVIFLKSLCDYDFISTILVSMEIPLVYYALKNRWPAKVWFIRSLRTGAAGLGGFILGILFHILQLSLFYGSLPQALDFLRYTIGKRTGAFQVMIEMDLADSFIPSVQEVVWSYLVMDRPDREPVLLGLPALPWIAGLFLCLIFLAASREYFPSLADSRRKLFALLTAAFLSVLGVFSWLILSKGHSVIHHHINYILWALPFTFLVSAVAGAFLECIGKDVFLWSKTFTQWIWNDSKRITVFCLIVSLGAGGLFVLYQNNRTGAKKMLPLVIRDGKRMSSGKASPEVKWFFLDGRMFLVAERNARLHSYFVHFYPEKLQRVPGNKQQAGGLLYNFTFEKFELPSAFYSKYRLAMIKPPPGFVPVSIHYGEFSPQEGKLWEKLETP